MKASRWFAWSTGWARFRPLWSFLKHVYTTWQLMMSDGDVAKETTNAEQEDAGNPPSDTGVRGSDPIAARKSAKQQMTDLVKGSQGDAANPPLHGHRA